MGCKAFAPNMFVDIEDTLQDKLSALACYEGERSDHCHPHSAQILQDLSAYWGLRVGRHVVEAFVVLREMT